MLNMPVKSAAFAMSLILGSVFAGEGVGSAAAEPRAVKVARTRVIPACTRFVDAAAAGGTGTVARPFKSITAAIAAAPAGAIICVAQGVYRETLQPGTKPFTLAGGFQRGKAFKVRDSARYISKAQGDGTGSFIRIEDPGPTGNQLTAIDGFEITGYSQAIYRDIYYSQRFNITNNYIHDNVCAQPSLAGAGFALNNVSGTIRGNVFLRNSCDRGGAGFLNDSLNENTVSVLNNRVEKNTGTEPATSHGGALYFFTNRLTITGNEIIENTVTGYGGGLFVGAYTPGGQFTNARMSWNIYRGNRAGGSGGGFFCDDGANCTSEHEIYDGNCGGNIYVDGGSDGSGPTIARFNHVTSVRGRTVGCGAAGAGVRIDKADLVADTYSFTNAIFWGNAAGTDFSVSCERGCASARITVTYSMVQRKYVNNGGLKITFGAGIVTPKNPLFVAPAIGDFHLKSRSGHFTATGRVLDAVSSPALAKANPAGTSNLDPACAGNRSELGTYGNSTQASCVP
ncbi:hypothetical protein BH10PSE7_BH10PSE7_14060 [soil metagenome]